MNVYQTVYPAYDVGDGERVELFVSGCPFDCPFCFNQLLRDRSVGHEYSEDDERELFSHLANPECTGLTVVGGEPLAPYNRDGVLELCRNVKERFPDRTIWVYTGYAWDAVKKLPVMEYIDVLVAGPYIQQRNTGKSKWRGSDNQYCVDVQRSKEELVYWRDFDGTELGPVKTETKDIATDADVIEELKAAVRQNMREVKKDSSDYGKGLTAGYYNVLNYLGHLELLEKVFKDEKDT